MDGGHTCDVHSQSWSNLQYSRRILGSDYPFCIHIFLVWGTIYSIIFMWLSLEVHRIRNESKTTDRAYHRLSKFSRSKKLGHPIKGIRFERNNIEPMYSDYQQTGTRVQPVPISKRLPQIRKSPSICLLFYHCPRLIWPQCRNQQTMYMEVQCCETRQMLISPIENRKKKSTGNFFPETILKHRPRRLRRP